MNKRVHKIFFLDLKLRFFFFRFFKGFEWVVELEKNDKIIPKNQKEQKTQIFDHRLITKF